MEIVACIMSVIVVATIVSGICLKADDRNKKREFCNKVKSAIKLNMAVMALLMVCASFLVFSNISNANTNEATDTAGVTQTEEKVSDSSKGMAYIAAALSTGLATIGAGIAVAIAGSAALGAISEDSKLLGKTLIFVGLAEGIAIYGLIISIMILNKV